MSLDQRLLRIATEAYARLRRKLIGGRIRIDNEASMQLQYASILQKYGELYEESPTDVFSIELEKTVELTDADFVKSGSRRANIDIFISLANSRTAENCSLAIELKYFKKKNHREPNNRYDVFRDIHNLENYGLFAEQCLLIVATDHSHYVDQDAYSVDTQDFDFRHTSAYTSGTELNYNTANPYGPPIRLNGSYDFAWDEISSSIKFLFLGVQPT